MKLFYKIFFLFSLSFAFAQSPDCSTASAMCSGQGGPYNNTHPGTPGGNQTGYGSITACGGSGSHGNNGSLGSTPRPAWFTFQIGQSGPIDLNLQQFNMSGTGIDVDFALWGPFSTSNLSTICTSLSGFSAQTNPANNHPSVGYTGPCNLVDASYSPTFNETVHFPNAIAGETYLLLVTNYSTQQGTYTINQINVTPTSGQISCNVVCGVNLGPDQLFCSQFITSHILIANFNQAPTTPGTPTYSWYLGGNLQATTTTNSYTVNQSGTWSVSVTRPGCSDIATDEVEIRFAAPPILNTPNNLNAPNGACSHTFNLRDVELGMLNPALPSNYVIKYYLDEGDCFAGNGNFIVDPTAFTVSSTTTIYVRVENLGNPSCSNSEQYFDVVINCIPTACSISLSSPAGTNNQNICQGDALTNILYTTSGTVTNVTVSGLPSGLTTNFSSNTFTISGTPTQTGTFNYTVTTVGCSPELSQNGTIVVNSIPSVPVISTTLPTCSSDGVSTITNYNAAASYVFSPSGPTVGAGGLISGMTIGTSYTVTATVGSCTSAASSPFVNNLILATPNTPTVAVQSETCASNGLATVTNYDASLTYTFNPTGPSVGASGAISGMVPGTNYTLVASNGSCTSIASSSFSVNAMLVTPAIPTITTLTPTCVVDGSSTISNYNSSLTYIFTPAGPSVGAGGAIIGMVTGTSYTVVSNNGVCTSVSSVPFTNALQLTIPVIPTISVAAPTCSLNGVATITNYVAGLTYVFTPSGPSVNSSGVISGMSVGVNYIVAASNGSCSSPDSSVFSIAAMLTSPSTPVISSVLPTCTQQGSSSVSNYNTSLNYTFTPSGPSIDATGLILGMNIGTTYTLVSSDGTCSSLTSSSFSNLDVLSSPSEPTLSVENVLVCSGERAIFVLNGTPNNVITYSIDGGSQQEITLNTQGSGVVEVVTSSANVSIQLLNINNGNCSLALTNSATVAVQLCSIPKGISPNGDGKNDVWDLSNFDIKKVEIFNRYGTKVYSKSNYENEWHGQSDNGNDLPDGTYYFVIDFTDLETKSGWIYINREH